MSTNAPHFGRPSSTGGKSSEKIKSMLRGREEANKINAASVAKYIKKKITEKLEQKGEGND